MAPSPSTKQYGFRSLPDVLDDRAKSGYSRPVAMFPKTLNVAAGFREVSYIQLANAVNRACSWLEETIKDKEGSFAYFGPNDLRYIIFVIASMKTHRKILVASLRNTVQAQTGLFERTNCKVIVSCESLDQSLQPIFAASKEKVRKVLAPSLDSVLADELVPHYEYVEPAESEDCSRFLHIHTSGSSGNPKPITYTHEIIRCWDAPKFLPAEQGESLVRTMFYHQKALCLLPCFHAGGLAVNMFATLLDMTLILGHPDVPMTAQYVAELLKSGVVTTLLSPPSILEELADDPAAQASLSNISHIAYAGGPLRPATGEKLAKIVPHLFSYIGATECGWFHNLSGSNKVWNSLKFYSDLGYIFDEISPGIFELVIIKDDQTNKFQPIFQVFPEINEYRTRDLYSRNEENPGWWKYRGRADDLIVLSNGEKINPIPLENVIVSHPSVKAALVVGEYRFIPSLLVELNQDHTPRTEIERHQLLDSIWAVVQEANKIAPGFSKIPKSLILLADSDKQFLRAGKGTIQRQLTVQAYAEELERLYGSQEVGLLAEGLTLTKSNSPSDIATFVREIYVDTLEAGDLSDTENMFERGLDSLRVMIIVQRLRAALTICEISVNFEDVNPRLVYSGWSVQRMTKQIVGLANVENESEESNEDARHPREARIKSMIEKYTENMPPDLPVEQANEVSTSSAPWTVILTGTTGSLGSYLLAGSLALPASRVKKIYCINRSTDASKRQEQSNRARGISTNLKTRVEFLCADLSKTDFALGHDKYAELLQEATVIIHSAWKVDFNLTLESFEPQIQGVRNLLDFGIKSTNKAPVIFISSISTALNFLESNPSNKVPEDIVQEFEAPDNLGYGESKFVGEHILNKYSKATGQTTVIFRTGQIAGPLTEKGFWNKQEWFPSLVASSKYLGALPESLGSMEVLDWIPVDLLSTIMIELTAKVLHQNSAETSVYNLVNPKSITWSEVRHSVQEILGIEKSVSLKEWVSLLEKSRRGIVAVNPAVKLLDFFQILSEKEIETSSRYEVGRLVRDSSAAGDLNAVSVPWLKLWIQQWNL